eukprot:3930434-Pleurochrysis_carterae.AAC.2
MVNGAARVARGRPEREQHLARATAEFRCSPSWHDHEQRSESDAISTANRRFCKKGDARMKAKERGGFAKKPDVMPHDGFLLRARVCVLVCARARGNIFRQGANNLIDAKRSACEDLSMRVDEADALAPSQNNRDFRVLSAGSIRALAHEARRRCAPNRQSAARGSARAGRMASHRTSARSRARPWACSVLGKVSRRVNQMQGRPAGRLQERWERTRVKVGTKQER